MKIFTTGQGEVTLSEQFSSIYHKQKQVEVKYTPYNHNGWGVSRNYDADTTTNFSQHDAEAFARNADSKLRINGGGV